MKEIIYNLILAFIGLFVIYIIFYNYLGLNNEQEPFEVDDENNPTPYDPKDAVDPSNPDPPSPAKPAAGDPVTSEDTNIPALPKGAEADPNASNSAEGYSNDESDTDDEPTTIFGKISNFLFGSFEGFRLRHHQINRAVGRRPRPHGRPRYRGYHRRRDRHRRHRRRRRHNAHHHWRRWYHHHYRPWRSRYHRKLRAWRRRRHNYIRAWWRNWRRQRWLAWRRRRARAAARRRAMVRPYMKKWRDTRNQVIGLRNAQNWANRTIRNRHERNRLGRDVIRKFPLYHRMWNENFPWHNWRNQSWANSALHHMHRRRPRYGRWYKWGGSGLRYDQRLNMIRARVRDKKRRDAEARKTNKRKAHWSRLVRKGHNKVGRFNKSRKGHMPGAFYGNLINTYGLNQHIRNWKDSQIQDAHKMIDDTYDKEMRKRIAAMRARQMFAINARRAAMEQRRAAQAAAAGLAKADAEAAAEAAKAAAKAARENANAVSRMSSTLANHKQSSNALMRNVHRNAYETRRFTGVNKRHDDMLRSAQTNKNTMDDLLKLQAGRVAKVEAVPMADIKKISLQARKNYDASVTQKLNNA